MTSELDLGYAVSVSMDGPAVNWKFYDKLQTNIGDEFAGRQLLNIGSCGLHTLHNAFKSCFSGWSLDKVLSSLYHLFKKAPARREDFLAINPNAKFPSKFCGNRWLENQPAVERALEIWPQVENFVKAVRDRKVNRPSCASFDVVKGACSDPLISAKFNFFLSMSMIFTPFLTKYQCDKPMIAFLATDLYELMRSILLRVVDREKMSALTSPSTLISFELSEDNLVDYPAVDVGFVTDDIIKDLVKKRKGGISDRQAMEFRMECRKGVVALLTKMMKKCPLRYELVNALSFLDPRKLGESDTVDKLSVVMRRMLHAKQLSSATCEKAKQQFQRFLDAGLDETFSGFDPENDRLDTFYASRLSGKKEFEQLWHAVRIMLLLSHGQASVERGFSVNKELLKENQAEETVVACRVVYDAVNDHGGVTEVPLTDEMMAYVKGSRQKYRQALEAKQKKDQDDEKKKKRESCDDEVKALRKRTKLIEKVIDDFEEKADELLKSAEGKGHQQMALKLAEALALKDKRKEKQKHLAEMNSLLETKEQELKNM